MREFFGSGIEVDIEAGAAVVLEVGYEGSAEGRLYSSVRAGIPAAIDQRIGTLPAPAGPMTRTPNLLILMTVTGFCAGSRGAIKNDNLNPSQGSKEFDTRLKARRIP